MKEMYFEDMNIIGFTGVFTQEEDRCITSEIRVVTDLIIALTGNSSVNTVQHATTEEAVFSVFAVTSRRSGWWSCDMCFCDACPFLGYISDRIRSETSQLSVGDSHGKFVVEEEYKKSACEGLAFDLKTLYILCYKSAKDLWR
jgi:hypothetical protein